MGTETQVVETLLMQRLDPATVFLVLYSAIGAGPLMPQGRPVTVNSLHFPQSKVLPQGVAWACAILIDHFSHAP